ncbi:MAG: leucine-rich repeat protein [Ruminococcus sp.]|nr:leucine-rich repeat protein [Ruminococcus sp.]
MKKFKKIISIAASLAMLIACVPIGGVIDDSGISMTASAEESDITSLLTYEILDDGTIEITGCDTSAEGDLEIPSEIDGYTVTSIGDRAFYNYKKLTSVTIPDSVTSIGDSAFYSCTKLTSVTIPDGVTSIGGYAFYFCYKLNSITIPNGVTSIEDCVFGACDSLTSVTIPDSVRKIKNHAFFSCDNLSSVIIPDSVTSIGDYAFSDCASLESVTIGNSVTSIGNLAFICCESLTDVTIPDSVTSIGNNAFEYCTSLTSITIPDSVTSIGDFAFRSCTSLTSITVNVDNGNYSSTDGVLFDKNQTQLICCPTDKKGIYIIPNSVTKIEDAAFRGCINLTDITIPNSVTDIGNCTFYNCSELTTITIPDNITDIGEYTFSNCTSLKSITIGNSMTYIDSYAFSKCNSLTDVYYDGTESEWNEITIGEVNECLTNATIHYAEIPVTTEQISEIYYGDIDMNGEITISDAVEILSNVSNSEKYPLNSEQLDRADVYQRGDGLSNMDALSVQKLIAQVITSLPETYNS